MSFRITWPTFSADFLALATAQLTTALNKGEKPANIVDDIVVKELHMGTKPPDLEILEIGELSEERFRGIFKLTYSGDGFVVLQAKVQANPLNSPSQAILINPSRGFLAAHQPLVVPMQLRIANVKLRGICALVIDKGRGVTLSFKNDPLERVDVSSTFDNMPNVRRFLQSQIEGQLRKLFQEDLPMLVHTLSLRHLNSNRASAIVRLDHDKPQSTKLRPSDSGFVVGSTNDSPTRWYGNDGDQEGYVLFKNLSLGENSVRDRGLHRLFEPDRDIKRSVNRQRVWTRLREMERDTTQSVGPGPRRRSSSTMSAGSCPTVLEGYQGRRSRLHGDDYESVHSDFNAQQMRRSRQQRELGLPRGMDDLSTYGGRPTPAQSQYGSEGRPPLHPSHPPLPPHQHTSNQPYRQQQQQHHRSRHQSRHTRQQFDTFNEQDGGYMSDYDTVSMYSAPTPSTSPSQFTLKSSNSFAAQLASLSQSHYTISPYASLFEEEHFKFRSSPRKFRSDDGLGIMSFAGPGGFAAASANGYFAAAGGTTSAATLAAPRRVKRWRVNLGITYVK